MHTILGVLLIAIPWSAREIVRPRETAVAVRLIEPSPRPPTPHLRMPQSVVKTIPPPPVSHPVAFQAPPKPVIVPRQITIAELAAPIPPAPELKTAKVELPKIEPVAITRPAPVIKTGGFGNPEGALPSSSTAKGVAAPKLGAFDMPAGNSFGRGNGATQVASAGFGDVSNGSGTGSGGNSRGAVSTGGFGAYETPAPAVHASRPAAPAETPVEITFKPKPAYTAEAREKKIEGEVLLEVLFSADGQIHVLRVMRGLGFGLDENARAAATQIRFHPGTRGGTPVDTKGTLHIVFELS